MDKIKFQKRLELLYSSWNDFKNQNLWKNTKILVLYTHPKRESRISSSFFNWFLGYNSHNILLVVSRKYVHIICDENSKDILKPLEKFAVLNPKVIVKGKGRDRLADILNGVLKKVMPGNLSSAMTSGWIQPGLVVGYIQAEGRHLSSRLKMVETKALDWKDVTDGFLKVMTGDGSSSAALKESEVESEAMGKEGNDKMDGENEPEKDPLKEIKGDDKENDCTDLKDNGSSSEALKESEVRNKTDGRESDDRKDVRDEWEEDPWEVIEEGDTQDEWIPLEDDWIHLKDEDYDDEDPTGAWLIEPPRIVADYLGKV